VSFLISHRYGGDDRDPPLTALGPLLDEVDQDPADIEHTSVSVTHESGWCLGIYKSWRVTLENLDDLDVQPRHLNLGADRAAVLEPMRTTADGGLESLFTRDWQPGY
jgi:hypothetical protein